MSILMSTLMKEPEVTLAVAIEHGLNEEEFARINEILGRNPNYTELGVFSVMGSEHCSYKNSIAELKKLPRTGNRLLVGAGEENAGLVDIGDGLAIAFKIESHNHPSAVEPYQGAATGVGGILRDIFTMGARPIAALNSLRFGTFDHPRTRHLMRGVVKGIGDYGNSFGVPTVAGDVYFDECYNENPLVNAMAVGIVKHGDVAKAVARGSGNSVFIVGSSTGRDGIHGATFASEELSEESESRRPSVQVGDPFTEKLLLEATLEAIKAGCIVGVQDMGAAGITCSTSEMSAKGKSGMLIDIDEVPTREEKMTPYEVLLSESQERMLLVVEPGHEDQIKQIFEKWDLECKKIGVVTDNGLLRIRKAGRLVAEIPAEVLVLGGGAPVYHRETKMPEYINEARKFDFSSLTEPGDYNEVIRKLIGSANICSRNWVFTQYDSMVRTNTITEMTGDAAVVRIKETDKAIALKTDCNARYVYLNPFVGAQIAVAESARNVVCTGAKPIAITNCLNFGNPYKPEIFWQFTETIRGMAEACRRLETPVTGGNVSFYNESPEGAIYPTPVIGMLGLMNSVSDQMTAQFKSEGDAVLVLGAPKGSLGGSEYMKIIHGRVVGDAPQIDLDEEVNVQTACLEMIRTKIIKSAHDISEGGLAVALAECCILGLNHAMGAVIKLTATGRFDAVLFGEDQSRIIVSAPKALVSRVHDTARKHNIQVAEIGRVGGDSLVINDLVRIGSDELRRQHRRGLEERMQIGGKEPL